MRLVKSITLNPNKSIDEQVSDLDVNIQRLYTALQGRVSFGSGVNGEQGENNSGEFSEFTSHATPDTEFSVTHTMGVSALGAIVMWQNLAGHLYQGPTTGTAWDSTTVYFKCDVASVTFNVFLVR